MLRTIFVSLLLIVGWAYALKGPLYGLLLYLWIAYFRPEQWVWTDFFRTLPLSYVAGVYLVIRSAFSGTKFRVDVRVLLLALLLAWSFISTMLSPNSAYCLIYFRDFAKSVIITYLIAVVATDFPKLRLVVLTICLSLAFEAAKQGWAQLALNPGAVNANELPLFGDNNGVAVGMLMLVAFLVALARTSLKKSGRWGHRFLAFGVLYRAIATYSRGGFIAAGVLGVLYLLRAQRRAIAVIGIAVALAVTVPVLPPEFWNRMNTITVDEGEEREASSAGRLHFWAVAWEMAQDNPIFGVGHNGYNQEYDRYDFSKGEFGKRRSVHSTWFGALADLGFVGLFLFCANIWWALAVCRRVRRLAKRGEVEPNLGHFATAIESALVVACVGGTFVIFQYVELLWHTIGMSIALNWIASDQIARREAEAAPAPVTFEPGPPVLTAVSGGGRSR